MVQEAAVHENESQQQEPECRHHWIIEPPQGSTSWGQCKLCDARKEFANSAGDALWERDASSVIRNRWSGSASRGRSLPLAGLAGQPEEDEGF